MSSRNIPSGSSRPASVCTTNARNLAASRDFRANRFSSAPSAPMPRWHTSIRGCTGNLFCLSRRLCVSAVESSLGLPPRFLRSSAAPRRTQFLRALRRWPRGTPASAAVPEIFLPFSASLRLGGGIKPWSFLRAFSAPPRLRVEPNAASSGDLLTNQNE